MESRFITLAQILVAFSEKLFAPTQLIILLEWGRSVDFSPLNPLRSRSWRLRLVKVGTSVSTVISRQF